MDFWAQYEESERAIAAALELEEAKGRVARRLPQDAPAPCSRCPYHGVDVLFGLCPRCGSTEGNA